MHRAHPTKSNTAEVAAFTAAVVMHGSVSFHVNDNYTTAASVTIAKEVYSLNRIKMNFVGIG